MCIINFYFYFYFFKISNACVIECKCFCCCWFHALLFFFVLSYYYCHSWWIKMIESRGGTYPSAVSLATPISFCSASKACLRCCIYVPISVRRKFSQTLNMYKAQVIDLNSIPQRTKKHQNVTFLWGKIKIFWRWDTLSRFIVSNISTLLTFCPFQSK